MLKMLRSLVVPLAKLALSIAAIIFGVAVAIDFLGSVSLAPSRLLNHAFVGVGVGVFGAGMLALVALVFHLLMRVKNER
jgi:threonine/homoserine efflux transporter RhtA